MAEEDILPSDVWDVFYQYEDDVRREFDRLTQAWPHHLNHKIVRRVLGALLARQITLALSLVADPVLWNPHLGPLILRSMLENWLKMEWLMKDPLPRATGIAKSDLVCMKSKLEKMVVQTGDEAARTQSQELIEFLGEEEELFNSTIKPVMIDARQMARKAGGEALIAYRRHHVLFSSCVHSSWHHIARFNLIVNPNPLHRYHFVPMWESAIAMNISFPLLAADYCDRANQSVFENYSIQESPYKKLLTNLEILGVVRSLPPDEEYSKEED